MFHFLTVCLWVVFSVCVCVCVYVLAYFLLFSYEFGCQHWYNQLRGKTCLCRDLLCVEGDIILKLVVVWDVETSPVCHDNLFLILFCSCCGSIRCARNGTLCLDLSSTLWTFLALWLHHCHGGRCHEMPFCIVLMSFLVSCCCTGTQMKSVGCSIVKGSKWKNANLSLPFANHHHHHPRISWRHKSQTKLPCRIITRMWHYNVFSRICLSVCNALSFGNLDLESSFLMCTVDMFSESSVNISRSSGRGEGHGGKKACLCTVSCLWVFCLWLKGSLVWLLINISCSGITSNLPPPLLPHCRKQCVPNKWQQVLI